MNTLWRIHSSQAAAKSSGVVAVKETQIQISVMILFLCCETIYGWDVVFFENKYTKQIYNHNNDYLSGQ